MVPKNLVPRDFFGQILEEGDLVIAAVTSKSAMLDMYTIISFDMEKWTKRKGRESVPVEILREGFTGIRTATRCSLQLVKIDPKLVTFRDLL